jgi:excisionase family DNA binding protein
MPPKVGSGGLQRRLMTIQEAAAYLAVPVPTLYTRVWQRRIPFVRLGRSIRFDKEDLDGLVDSSKVRPSQNRR